MDNQQTVTSPVTFDDRFINLILLINIYDFYKDQLFVNLQIFLMYFVEF